MPRAGGSDGRGLLRDRSTARDYSTPHRFRRRPKTARYRARSAMSGPAARLFAALGGDAYLFTLSPADLGLSAAHTEAAALYDHSRMAELRAAVSGAFLGPLLYAVEVGAGTRSERGHVHVHVIGHRDDGPRHIRRGCERCKPVHDPLGMLEYLHKPAEPYSVAAEIDYKAAQVMASGQRAPKTRGYLYGVSRLAWVEAQVGAQCTKRETFAETPKSDPVQRAASKTAAAQPSGSITPNPPDQKKVLAGKAERLGCQHCKLTTPRATSLACRSDHVQSPSQQGSRLHSRPSRSITAAALASLQTAPAHVDYPAGRERYTVTPTCAAPRRGPICWVSRGLAPPGLLIGHETTRPTQYGTEQNHVYHSV